MRACIACVNSACVSCSTTSEPGFSSLNYLAASPFDKIKIDKVFVTEATTRADCQAIVASLAELAAKLGMSTTAEGIETEEQLELVQAARLYRRTGIPARQAAIDPERACRA